MRAYKLFNALILTLFVAMSAPGAYGSLLSIDRPQIIDQRGNPVVNATIFIGEGNRDPEIFPKLAYADQDRTSVLGSQLTTDSSGRFPKAYIEPPYSYRIRTEDGSQFDEQLFSFGIVEIDYTPGGTGTEAINVGGGSAVVPDGSITQAQLDSSIQGLLSDIGINSANISQEITDRANALAAEASTRATEIQAAVDAANAGDTTVQGNVDALTQSVTANADGLTAQNIRITAAESNLIDVYDDGTNIGLTAFATDIQTTQSAVENPTTGLAATRTLATETETRLNDLDGDASGRTIESLVVEYDQLAQDVATGVAGAASVQSVDDVNVRVDNAENSITSLSSQLTTVSSSATQAATDAAAAQGTADTANTTANNALSSANSAVSTATAAQSTANGNTTQISSIASQITTVSATATQASTDASNAQTAADNAQTTANGLSASVTTNSTAIADLENGVAAQWEVQTTAAGVTGSVGLYNDNGTTKFLVKADDIEADRGNGPESLFDADGLLDEVFSRSKTKISTQNYSATATLASGQASSAAGFDMDSLVIAPGESYQYFELFVVLEVNRIATLTADVNLRITFNPSIPPSGSTSILNLASTTTAVATDGTTVSPNYSNIFEFGNILFNIPVSLTGTPGRKEIVTKTTGIVRVLGESAVITPRVDISVVGNGTSDLGNYDISVTEDSYIKYSALTQ